MDAKAEVNKLWKDLQDSAREFASFGLQVSGKALDATTGALNNLKDEVHKKAEKLAQKPDAEANEAQK